MAAITNIQSLQASGGLVSEEPVKRSGIWHHNGQEDEVDFFVLRLAFGSIDRVYNADNPDASQSAALIALAIRLGENGDEKLSYKQAYQLDSGLAMLFSDHVMKVNGVGDEEARTNPKVSARKTSSGSKSAKQSAAQSEKPSND